jgi:hypothetical protein
MPDLFLIAFILIFWSNAVWWLVFSRVMRTLANQAKINEALAHYVSADLKQTWQKSAEELVESIRGPKNK